MQEDDITPEEEQEPTQQGGDFSPQFIPTVRLVRRTTDGGYLEIHACSYRIEEAMKGFDYAIKKLQHDLREKNNKKKDKPSYAL